MAASIFGSIGLHFHVHQSDPKDAPHTLTKAQLEKIFTQFDTNRDNLLSREELQNAFAKLGAWFPGYRANRALSHADANGDGQVDLNELDDLIKYALELGYTVKAYRTLNHADANGGGFVDLKELDDLVKFASKV